MYRAGAVDVQNGARQRVGIVAGKVAGRRRQRPLDQLDPHLRNALTVDRQHLRALGAVALRQLRRDGRRIGKAQLHHIRRTVAQQRRQMVGGGVALGLAVLCHDVADIDLLRVGRGDGLRHAVHQQVRDDARIQTPRPEEDEVRRRDGVERIRERLRVRRQKLDVVDAAVLLLFEAEDIALADNVGAVFKGRRQSHVRRRDRNDRAADGKHLPHAAHRLVKRAGDAVERCEQEIAEALPAQRAALKAIGQELLHDRLGVRERLHAVADVAGRQHPDIPPQHTAAAAVVRHSDDGGQIFRVFFQPAQHGGKARAAADGDDMRSLRPQLTARKHRAHTQSSFPRRPQRTGAKDFSIFKAAPRNLASRSGEARRRNCAAMP